jgi:Tol biopolymer transport system component
MIGKTIAHYKITEKIGAGGMGEVYRARDTKLNRDVALKIIPEIFSADAQRMGRFQREAQLLATLNHANIATIYGVEEAHGQRALVLELVEGDDLSEKIRAGAIPVPEALEIGLQIAEALEAAHERGVIHRDLKPANVKVTPDGKVKVLDFGLAKALEADTESGERDPSQSLSPTMTMAATMAGVILGTAAYMSPEQARGKVADRRSDIWSFGVVLFEMLVRKQVFGGETISDTLAGVIKDDPDWSLLPVDTPPPVMDLLIRCLQKDPRRRLQSIGDARIVLEDTIRPQSASMTSTVLSSSQFSAEAGQPGAAGSMMPFPAADVTPARSGPGMAAWAASLLVMAVLAAVAGWMWRPAPPAPNTRQFHIDPIGLQVEYPANPALSPDGRHLAFFVGQTLWIRNLDSLEAVEIPGSDGSAAPFWSHNGAWLAFGRGSRIYKVPASGGNPTPICDTPFVTLDGGTWGEDEQLILAPNSGPLFRVSSRGGDPQVIFPAAPGESDFHTPSALPAAGAFLFTSHRPEGRDTIEVFADGKRKIVLRIVGARLEYAAWAPSGHLVFHRQNNNEGIWAMPFDLDTLEVSGDPFIVAAGGAFPSIARDGSLVYALGGSGGLRQLVTVDRSGEIVNTIGQAQSGMLWPELSPDGRSVLVSAQEADNRDVWLHDIQRGTRTRMTFGPEVDWTGIWMNDGKDIAFTNGSAQSNNTYLRPADGSREPELLLNGYYPSYRDGLEFMAFNVFSPDDGDSLYYRAVDGDSDPIPFLKTPAAESGVQISPSGDHAVYMSNETGNNQVYMTTFPGGEGKWQVSTHGGAWPRWSRAGDEIIYRQGTGLNASMMSVSVQTSPHLQLESPVRLFGAAEHREIDFSVGSRSYDTSANREHLVMVKKSGDEADHIPRLVYSENWYAAYLGEAK